MKITCVILVSPWLNKVLLLLLLTERLEERNISQDFQVVISQFLHFLDVYSVECVKRRDVFF